MTQDGKFVIGLDFNGTCVSYNYPHSIGGYWFSANLEEVAGKWS